VIFQYGLGNVTDHIETSYNTQTNGGSPGAYSKCLYYPKGTDLSTTGFYQAKVDLYDTSTDGLLANSPVIYFNLISGTQGDYPASTETSSSTIPSCTQANFIARSACEVAQFLFVPPVSVLNNFNSLSTTMQTKVPFVYFYDIQTDISGLSPSGGTVPTFTYTDSTTGGLDISTDLFSPTTLTAYAGSTAVGVFRTLIQYSLYLGFGYFVYRTIHGLIRS